MIAAACIGAQLAPQAFGVDEADVPMVAEEILRLLREEADRAKQEELAAKLR